MNEYRTECEDCNRAADVIRMNRRLCWWCWSQICIDLNKQQLLEAMNFTKNTPYDEKIPRPTQIAQCYRIVL